LENNFEAIKLNELIMGIWTKPRLTIKRILNENYNKHILWISAIAGIVETLDSASAQSMGDELSLPVILLIAVFGGGLGGMLSLHFISWTISFTGKWIRGKGTIEEIKTAVGWSNSTALIFAVIWIVELLIFKSELFTQQMPIMESSLLLSALLLIFTAFEVILLIWAFIIFCKCITEAHGFSFWKGLLNIVLSILVFIGPILLISGVI
jgi:hypothetical protein